jgi:hypothetical protein
MAAYDLNPNDPKAVARLLVALAIEQGGELRLKGVAYDSLEKGYALLLEYDRATSEIVVRVTSGKIMLVPPENQAWLRPKEEVPIEREKSQAQQEVIRRSFRSDEELAELEEALNRKQTLAREVGEGKGTKFRTVPPTTQA